MLDRIRKMFTPICDTERLKAENDSLRERCDRLKTRYDYVLDEYEKLSTKYFALKLGRPERYPEMKGEHAPKCVRKKNETWSYFRMEDGSCIPAFTKFLRNSGHWVGLDEPKVRRGRVKESLEPVVEFVNEKGKLVQIPCGCVFMTNDASPRIEWLVIPEETFEVEWAPI